MSQTLSVVATKQGLAVEGDLVYATVSGAVEQARQFLSAYQAQSVTIDCQKMNKLDSAGIALLIEWKRWCHQHQKEFHLVGIKEKGFSLISTYKFKTILGLKES